MKYLAIIAAAAALGAGVPANAATTINFNLTGSGFNQDTPVPGDIFASQGVLFTGELGLITACGGACLSDGAAAYSGAITGAFLGPVFNLSLDGVTNEGTLFLYDQAGSLFQTIIGNTSNPSQPLSYSGSTAISTFKYDLSYDGIYSMTFDDVAVSGAVPEPSTWLMMLLGLSFIGGAMRSVKRRQKVTVSFA